MISYKKTVLKEFLWSCGYLAYAISVSNFLGKAVKYWSHNYLKTISGFLSVAVLSK